MKKWIQGIFASVVAGLVVWFLTRSPHSPWVGPKVELADVDVPESITAGEKFEVTFRATNQRDKAQPGCEGFVEITAPKDNGAGDSASEEGSRTGGDDNAQAPDSTGDFTEIDVADIPATRDIERISDLDAPSPDDDTSASDRVARSDLEGVELAREIDVSEVLQAHRLPREPVVPDAVTVPVQPSLFAERHSVCNTVNPEFTLRGVSGSAVQVMVDCVVHRPGVFQITYGIHCAKEEGSMWRLDHRGYIKVEES